MKKEKRKNKKMGIFESSTVSVIMSPGITTCVPGFHRSIGQPRIRQCAVFVIPSQICATILKIRCAYALIHFSKSKRLFISVNRVSMKKYWGYRLYSPNIQESLQVMRQGSDLLHIAPKGDVYTCMGA